MIDKATVAQILDAADIVDVVSDFVSLKRRGANYVGLCPFHNEKTPSFSVSRAKGICHCFSCGKGGSPVNFIMEHEQLSYYEALKYLANKYHIEIHERELTDAEKLEQSDRESMLIINEAANKHFEDNLFNSADGRNIGLSYFNERGFSEQIIRRFHLGYSLDKRNDLFETLTSKGYNSKYLFETGLCIADDKGSGYDRFRGRVMFPVLNLAGKIIAFGGRTLKHDKAKYVNSPESLIYKKSNELYGLYQAKHAITKLDKCFLVEGYADVISMHQSGFENTVASSGTSLTEGQIRLIHRFTDNITVLYDGDAAGIKASLRSIDLLLAEGLNIKVLLLPDGDDPDSFSRKHSTSEIQNFIDSHEEDFIRFKIRILLQGCENDPIKRSEVITDVIKSISVIPFPINRSVYTQECSRLLDIDEQVLKTAVEKNILDARKKNYQKATDANIAAATSMPHPIENAADVATVPTDSNKRQNTETAAFATSEYDKLIHPHEENIIRYILKYGMSDFCDAIDENQQSIRLTLLEYIREELAIDDMKFSNHTFAMIYDMSCKLISEFKTSLTQFCRDIDTECDSIRENEISKIRQECQSLDEIDQRENKLNNEIAQYKESKIVEFRNNYLEKILCSCENDDIRKTALELVSEKHHLSKIHTKFYKIKTEFDRLVTLIPEAIYNWKSALILCQIKEIQKKLDSIKDDKAETESLLKRIQELFALRSQLAKYLGDRVVNPKI